MGSHCSCAHDTEPMMPVLKPREQRKLKPLVPAAERDLSTRSCGSSSFAGSPQSVLPTERKNDWRDASEHSTDSARRITIEETNITIDTNKSGTIAPCPTDNSSVGGKIVEGSDQQALLLPLECSKSEETAKQLRRTTSAVTFAESSDSAQRHLPHRLSTLGVPASASRHRGLSPLEHAVNPFRRPSLDPEKSPLASEGAIVVAAAPPVQPFRRLEGALSDDSAFNGSELSPMHHDHYFQPQIRRAALYSPQQLGGGQPAVAQGSISSRTPEAPQQQTQILHVAMLDGERDSFSTSEANDAEISYQQWVTSFVPQAQSGRQ